MKQKFEFHYAWLILIACFALYGGTMGAGYNLNGIFNSAISASMGWKISEYTVSMVFLGAASALTLTFADRVFRRWNLKLVLGISIFIYALTLALKCICSQLWHFYLLYAINGAASAFLFYLPVPMLLNAWFRKKQGFALGIAMLSSGIIGAILNPVVSALIEQYGWRTAAVINGVISLLIALPPVLLFAKKTPQEMNLAPFGAVTGQEMSASPDAANQKKAGNGPASDITPEEKKKLFLFCFVLAMIVLIISMIPQQLSHFAQVNGLGAATGALMVSIGMAGNMTSKAIMGPCVDRFGKKKTFTVSFLLVAAAFLIYALIPGAPLTVLFPAAFLTGITAANNVIVMPFMVGVYSDGDEYTRYMSRVSVATMIGTAFGTFTCSAIYDLTGSYTPEFLLFTLFDLLCLVIIRKILSYERS